MNLFQFSLICGLVSLVSATDVLIFYETQDYRHYAIDNGLPVFRLELTSRGLTYEETDNSVGYFTDANLAQYKILAFFYSQGDTVFDAAEQLALQNYIQTGGSYFGVHSAAATMEQWPWYSGLVGASFDNHPVIQESVVRVEDHAHPASSHLPHRWVLTDEWYNFDYSKNPNIGYGSPRDALHVLATLDETYHSGGNDGPDHPIAWCQIYEGARSFYTGLGHVGTLWAEPDYVTHVMNGFDWARGAIEGDCTASLDQHYSKSIIDTSPIQPTAITAAPPPDERIFWLERTTGKVQLYRPSTAQITTAATLDIFSGLGDGMIGIILDPDFLLNNYVYLFYSPSAVSVNRLARFTLVGDTLDLNSEVVVLDVPVQRQECCHTGGHMKFDLNGDLWLTTGDNVNPFGSSGYSPTDETPGRAAWDAQGTSANTNDLRGKILRVSVNSDGTYNCPVTNLFYPGDATHRCEIYIMGNRNPYRMAANHFIPDLIYWGDVGPDAGSSNPNRGPAGHDEVNRATDAGNFGWPYCVGDNIAYNDYNFATSTSGALFDCSNGQPNDSPNNNGDTGVPPAPQGTMVWYTDIDESDPEAIPSGGGRTSMLPYMHMHDPSYSGDCGLPQYYNNSLFFMEWSRDVLRQFILDDDGDMLHAVPLWDSFEWRHPIDGTLASDGSFYVIEFGTDFDGTGARVSRMCYNGGQASVICSISADVVGGDLPLTVNFDSTGSNHNQALTLNYEWDFDGDGNFDATGPLSNYTYNLASDFQATLRVYQASNPSIDAICSVSIAAGNNIPQIKYLMPPLEGGIFDWGSSLIVEVEVTDVEDGSTPGCKGISCQDVLLLSSLGHNDHAHNLDQASSCNATFITSSSGHTDAFDWLFWSIGASYTDQGAYNGAVDPAFNQNIIQIHPRRRQAEKWDAVANPDCSFNSRFEQDLGCTKIGTDVGGGLYVGWTNDGDWVRYDKMNPFNTDSIHFRVATDEQEDNLINVRMGDPVNGYLLATAIIPYTGGWDSWTSVTVPMNEPNMVFELDLGSEQLVSRLELNSVASPGEYPQGYMVFAADTNGNYGAPIRPVSRVDQEDQTDTDGVIDIFFRPSVSARYFKILQTGSGSSQWSINELNAFDHINAPISKAGWSVSASRDDGVNLAPQAIDGLVNTAWSSGVSQYSGPYDIYLVYEAVTTDTLGMYNINYFEFVGGDGMSGPGTPPPPTPSPVTPAPTPSPVTPAPTPSPVTPAPTPSPVTPAPTPSSPTYTVVHAINTGDVAYLASTGINYDADRAFSGGSISVKSLAVSGTVDDTLYLSGRFANDGAVFSYNLAVTSGNQYRITLMFSEVWSGITAGGQRVFDVVVEGNTALTNVDPYAAVGYAAAYDLQYTYTATDSSLDIEFISIIQNARITALLVEQVN